jgi:phosphate transport system permease protein
MTPVSQNRISSLQRQDRWFERLTKSAALSIPAMFGGILFTLTTGSWESINKFGLDFFTHAAWDEGSGVFGGLGAIVGTLATTAVAVPPAVYCGRRIAAFLTEDCPQKLRQPIATAVETLAAVPSIVYGLFGFTYFVPFMQQYAQPTLTNLFEDVPVLSTLFRVSFWDP